MILIPTYVFLESALSFLGMSDPDLPTWGMLVRAAFAERGFSGLYHVVLVPAILMLAIGMAAALLSHALDRVLNPQFEH